MYETYWNLMEKPFRNVTDKKYFVYTETYEEAYLRLLYSATESQGLFLLTGEGGCGKTFLAKVFVQDMLEQGHRVAMIGSPTFAPEQFLQQILCEFGVDCSNRSRLELLQELRRFLATVPQDKRCILFLDNAHLVPNTPVVEDIRMLLTLESGSRLLLAPVLIGRPELGDLVARTSLRERVALQYRLSPLSCAETAEYIYSRMEKAGCGREIFTQDAVREIHAASGGVPSEINHICDLALLLGYGENAIVVEQGLAGKAIEDLKGSHRTRLAKSQLQ